MFYWRLPEKLPSLSAGRWLKFPLDDIHGDILNFRQF
jgi:hypothetical protein